MISDARPFIPTQLPSSLASLRVLIFGLGKFGGGVGAARFFAERGARVTVTDISSPTELQESQAALADVPISEFILGEHRDIDFQRNDWIVVNPAISPKNPYLEIALAAGAILTSEMDLFLRWCPSHHSIGVSGSNGKSTTCLLINNMLKFSDVHVWLGGNIGRSLLPCIDQIKPHHRVVLELSSFQLERVSDETPLPQAVGITQYSANHLDWHGGEQAYLSAKERMLRPTHTDSLKSSLVVLPSHATHLDRWRAFAKPRRVLLFSGKGFPGGGCGYEGNWLTRIDEQGSMDSFLDITQSPLRGEAGRSNVACATALAFAMGATTQGVEKAILHFPGLPHRQEVVGHHRGVTFVNDSKATTPEASLCALEAYHSNIILIAGGSSKGAEFDEFAAAATRHCKDVILQGPTSDVIASTLRNSGFADASIHGREDFSQAFRAAVQLALPGDTVLLSPACASFDQFVNFEARGERFRALFRDFIQSSLA